MNYYNASDIQELTGLGTSASYDLIKNLNEKLKKEYPGTITLAGKIPKWYFDKKTMMKGDVENEKEKAELE